MDSTNNEILQSLRLMAWEKAKGELKSIPQASYLASKKKNKNVLKFEELLDKFILEVENKGLVEGV